MDLLDRIRGAVRYRARGNLQRGGQGERRHAGDAGAGGRATRPAANLAEPGLALRAAAVTADDRSYVAQLGAVLRQRDIAALRTFLEAQAGRYGDERQVETIRAQSDAELEVLMHRMIVSRPDLTS